MLAVLAEGCGGEMLCTTSSVLAPALAPGNASLVSGEHHLLSLLAGYFGRCEPHSDMMSQA